MNVESKRGLKEGIGVGVAAGIVFALAEVVVSAIQGVPALTPFRMFASIVLGGEALTATSLGVAFVVGALVHLAISAFYGLIYGAMASSLSVDKRESYGTEAFLGAGYGLAVWFVNFQIIARIGYPWFLDTSQLLQAILHAAFYGAPLAIFYAGAERRAHVPTTTVSRPSVA